MDEVIAITIKTKLLIFCSFTECRLKTKSLSDSIDAPQQPFKYRKHFKIRTNIRTLSEDALESKTTISFKCRCSNF